MLKVEKIKEILKNSMSAERYTHSLAVQKTAIRLAKLHGVSIKKASIAGLVHDCAKDLNNEEMLEHAKKFGILLDSVIMHQVQLLHGLVGAAIAKTYFCIADEEILNAIRYHTTGRENMCSLEKIIYLADYIEPGRNFPGVEELRRIALSDLDKATFMALEKTIQYVISKGELLHLSSIRARNYLLLQIKDNKRSREI